ncbi:MAG: DegT/DnrJ/EryC1/StrS family aminotransferase, partial [Candidatus Omnitrophica bacterium]|nr:DegT/DnrJ/EryC1/StrS family aminotransferase [Candidatus Omnitrophota bacterium]
GGNELKYVSECVRSNWISSAGGFIEKFEKAFKICCPARYALACSSGTAALHLALAALGIKNQDEVIVPTFTMIATANAVTYLGAKPVFVDADRVTWNIDTAKIEAKITKRTKAIIAVHTYGLPADMDKIMSIAKKHNLFVIEDAAEAHGAEYKGRRVGNIGDVSCFSFYANKIITTGEGGMVTTNNKEIAKRVKILRDHAFSEERHFWHKYLGYNYRMTNLQAAIGLAQVERFKSLVGARIRNARHYNFLLKDVKGIRFPPRAKGLKNVYWMYAILIEDNFGLTSDALRAYLAQKGIETRTFFIPIHLQPTYPKSNNEKFPVALELCRKGIYLPSAATLTRKDIEYVVRCIKSAQDKAVKR